MSFLSPLFIIFFLTAFIHTPIHTYTRTISLSFSINFPPQIHNFYLLAWYTFQLFKRESIPRKNPSIAIAHSLHSPDNFHYSIHSISSSGKFFPPFLLLRHTFEIKDKLAQNFFSLKELFKHPQLDFSLWFSLSWTVNFKFWTTGDLTEPLEKLSILSSHHGRPISSVQRDYSWILIIERDFGVTMFYAIKIILNHYWFSFTLTSQTIVWT